MNNHNSSKRSFMSKNAKHGLGINIWPQVPQETQEYPTCMEDNE
jgi:hypothetical protein